MNKTCFAAFCGLLLVAGSNAWSQDKGAGLKKALTGTTWTLASSELTDTKGVKAPMVQAKDPKGQLILGSNGRYSFQVIGAIPKIAKDRMATTAEEDKAVAHGLLTHYGTYTIDDSGKGLTFNIERSSFPNQNGQTAKRIIALKGDELVLDNPARMAGGQTRTVWKKTK